MSATVMNISNRSRGSASIGYEYDKEKSKAGEEVLKREKQEAGI